LNIAVSDASSRAQVERIHAELSEYMGVSIHCVATSSRLDETNEDVTDSVEAENTKPDNNEVSLSLTQMTEQWQPNDEADTFLVSNHVPQVFAQEQLAKFKQHYIANGKSAMF